MSTPKSKILVVDDMPENIQILSDILRDEYTVMAAKSGEKALQFVERQPPDLILLDIMMPGMDGFEVCKRLKADKKWEKIPVIFITAMNEIKDEARGFEVGAVDYINKPVSPPIVQARVRTHLDLADQQRACEQTIDRQLATIKQGQKDAIFMLGQAGHYNDDDTGVHIWRMARYARALAKAAGWNIQKQRQLLLAAPMHDTGKIGIPDSILKKPGKLTDEEWVVMREHTTIGHKILSLSKEPLFVLAAEVALYHHERWDGQGYPRKLAGENIPKSARIVALADVFDALTMKRPYKDPWPRDRAFEYISTARGQFDPLLVELFLGLHDQIVEIMEYWNKKQGQDLFSAVE
jgi:putative two-component system response regulator